MYLHAAEASSFGKLQLQVTSEIDTIPLTDATITISYTGIPETPLETLTTNSSGQTEIIDLPTPPVEYSLDPSIFEQPYSEYTFDITAPGYEPVNISGAELFADVTALQQVSMRPLTPENANPENFNIPAHTLYAEYPPKIPEAEIKPVNESGEIVLSRVVIPEFIVVHDGSPRDSTAKNYYVKYKDYIKNVASSEIYATWPTNTIRANVLAIMSFTLNRVYTEWYRNQGYDFTITSSTAFDHKWIHNRNIYDSISLVVDELFADYLSRPNVKQPILTQYCDGRQVQCPNWMPFLQEGTVKNIPEDDVEAEEIPGLFPILSTSGTCPRISSCLRHSRPCSCFSYCPPVWHRKKRCPLQTLCNAPLCTCSRLVCNNKAPRLGCLNHLPAHHFPDR